MGRQRTEGFQSVRCLNVMKVRRMGEGEKGGKERKEDEEGQQ